ncbi:MAG: 30S ribosome-binding factor RbfA [Spirochaetota bacterium]
MSEITIKRTEARISELISTLITQGVVKDPRLSTFVSITQVSLAKDYSFAKVFLSTFEEERVLDTAVSILNDASGLLQSRIGKSLKTRNTPKLHFVKDTSIRDGIRVNQIIDELDTDTDT